MKMGFREEWEKGKSEKRGLREEWSLECPHTDLIRKNMDDGQAWIEDVIYPVLSVAENELEDVATIGFRIRHWQYHSNPKLEFNILPKDDSHSYPYNYVIFVESNRSVGAYIGEHRTSDFGGTIDNLEAAQFAEFLKRLVREVAGVPR